MGEQQVNMNWVDNIFWDTLPATQIRKFFDYLTIRLDEIGDHGTKIMLSHIVDKNIIGTIVKKEARSRWENYMRVIIGNPNLKYISDGILKWLKANWEIVGYFKEVLVNQDLCSICRENIANIERVQVRLHCSHIHHLHCLRGWFQHRTQEGIRLQHEPEYICPLCRSFATPAEVGAILNI